MIWYKTLIPKETLYDDTNTLLNEFLGYYQPDNAKEIKEASVLSEYSEEGIIIYLSPKAAEISKPLLEKYGFIETPPPSERLNSLAYMMGDEEYFDNFINSL